MIGESEIPDSTGVCFTSVEFGGTLDFLNKHYKWDRVGWGKSLQ